MNSSVQFTSAKDLLSYFSLEGLHQTGSWLSGNESHVVRGETVTCHVVFD